jgi:hypothetical protein
MVSGVVKSLWTSVQGDPVFMPRRQRRLRSGITAYQGPASASSRSPVEHVAGIHECVLELVVIRRFLIFVPRHQVAQGPERAGELLGLGGGRRVSGDAQLPRHLIEQLGGFAERLARLVVPVFYDLRPAGRPIVEADA